MDPLTVGLGVASLVGNIFGNIQSGKANNANATLLQNQMDKNEAFYNNNVNRDFLETNAAKGLFERLRKQLRDNNKVIDSTAAVTGATDEAAIAEKSRNNENYNEAVNNLASQATGYQAQQEANYLNRDANLVNAKMNLNSEKAQNAANLANNASGLASAASNLPGTGTTGTVTAGITDTNRGRLNQIADSAFGELKNRLSNQFRM